MNPDIRKAAQIQPAAGHHVECDITHCQGDLRKGAPVPQPMASGYAADHVCLVGRRGGLKEICVNTVQDYVEPVFGNILPEKRKLRR